MIRHLTRTLLIVLAASTNAVAQTGYEPPQPAETGIFYEISDEAFGSFRVERRVEDHRRSIVMHGPYLVKEAIFSWTAEGELLEFNLTDNGYTIELQITPRTEEGGACINQVSLVPASPLPSVDESWLLFLPYIENAMDDCSLFDPANSASVLEDARRSMRFYGAAANAWKAVGRELFGSISRRCIRLRQIATSHGSPVNECSRWSEPQN